MQWGNEADVQLFKILLKTHDVKIDYKVLAEGMGNGITPKAITHRIGKIRSLPAEDGEGNPSPIITPKPVTSKPEKKPPRARAKAAATGSPTKGKERAKGKKRSAATIENSGDETYCEARGIQENQDGEESPTKKKVKLGEKFFSSQETDEGNAPHDAVATHTHEAEV
ncbi:hypothetical protein MMC07_000904 [Pseudocyphellaria aurata]|nr:hypothetical protein [Pseudocyphellaria aurata]